MHPHCERQCAHKYLTPPPPAPRHIGPVNPSGQQDDDDEDMLPESLLVAAAAAAAAGDQQQQQRRQHDLLVPMGTVRRTGQERVSSIRYNVTGQLLGVMGAGKGLEVFR